MIYINSSDIMPKELTTSGIFFNSELDNQLRFILEFTIKKKGHNVMCSIYTTEHPQIEIEDGTKVMFPNNSIEKMVTIDIWNKYYFPTWNNEENQYYHNDDGNGDEIGARALIMKIALKMGLEKGCIDTY